MKRTFLQMSSRIVPLVLPIVSMIPMLAHALTDASHDTGLRTEVQCVDNESAESEAYLFVSCGGFF